MLTLWFDVVSLQLSRKAQLSDIVKIIRLPTAKINLKENEVCKVAGWGITENGTLTNILRVVDVPVINKKVCKKQYSVINIRLPANVICAGGYPTHKGFCQVCFLLLPFTEINNWSLVVKCINTLKFFLFTGWFRWSSGVRRFSCWYCFF